MLRTPRRAVSRHWIVLAALLAGVCEPAFADAGWFESGDTQLRMDLQLLNDAEVIVLPMNQWPLPRAAVQYALANAKDHLAHEFRGRGGSRARARARGPSHQGRLAFDTGISGGRARVVARLRYAGARGRRTRRRASATTTGDSPSAWTSPRSPIPRTATNCALDGSHATVQWGNWLISANTLDRWWGPGHEGSLILSNNARPMPTLMVERAEARAVRTRMAQLARARIASASASARWKTTARTSTRRCSWPGASW